MTGIERDGPSAPREGLEFPPVLDLVAPAIGLVGLLSAGVDASTGGAENMAVALLRTVVGALFHDDRVTIAHVGDSRLYRLRGGSFEQLTSDHSLLQELVDRGFYSPEEAQRAANKNYVTRALGVEPNVEVGLREEEVDKGDHFVLCSDGLSDMVEDADIHLTINTFGDNLGSVAKHLIQLANDNGGRDNVSVLLAQVIDGFPARRGLVERVLGWFG
jgi:protein phosphatase